MHCCINIASHFLCILIIISVHLSDCISVLVKFLNYSSMSLLLVVVLLFFSSSCSVSSGQYYVSDDCSSVTQSPCNPLSVYAGNMSQYNDTIFYFIGTTNISNNYDFKITTVKNVTLHGLNESPSIYCNEESILVYDSSHISISSLTIYCSVESTLSNNITITNSSFTLMAVYSSITFVNAFDVKVLSSVFIGYVVSIKYDPLPVCSNDLPHYSMILTNVTLNNNSRIEVLVNHGTSYNISITFDHVDLSNYSLSPFLLLSDSLFYFFATKSSFHHSIANSSFVNGFDVSIVFWGTTRIYCNYPGVELTSTIVFEDTQFYRSRKGLNIKSDMILPGTMNYHFIIRSCLLYDNMNEGLFIDGTYLRSTQIDIIDTGNLLEMEEIR